MPILDDIRRDAVGAVRSALASPGFTLAALVTLALGIGATSAVFSVMRAVLLTPLPYEAPDRRVLIWSRWVSFDKTWLSEAEILDYRRLGRTMTDVAAWSSGQQNVTGAGDPVRVGVGFVTANTFDVLGARPLMGRGFTVDEDQPNGPPVAVLSHALWQLKYSGDPNILGRRIVVDEVPLEIVGVMPPGFRLPTDFTMHAAEPSALWRPLGLDTADPNRGNHGYYAAAVLAPGETAASASAELAAIADRLTADGSYPRAMQFTAFATSLDEEIRGGLRPALWLLAGAVACLLLLTCANVANLLLVRADARVRELAVRTALGAGPLPLARQLFVESLGLALGGALAGLAVGGAGLRLLVALDPTTLPPLAPVHLDTTVVLFTLGLAIPTTLVFGTGPILRATRLDLVDSLRQGSQQSAIDHRRQRVRGLLVGLEVALAVVLVIGAGLMARSLAALGRIDLGFRPDGVLTAELALPAASYDSPERVVGFYTAVLERIRSHAGVEHAGLVRALPLATTIGDYGLDVDGYEESPGRGAKGDWQIASDGAFEAMGQRLVRGRWFAPTDDSGSAPVAVVNETMARTYWPDGAAVGGRLRVGSNPQRPWATVVGIVADERHNGVTGMVKEKFYIPHAQWHVVTAGSLIRNVYLVVRSDGDARALASAIRQEVAGLDPTVPVANIRPMVDVVKAALATPRLTGFLLGSFAGLALVLAALGIYGVLSYVVARRTREIGVRMAMGASQGQVVLLVLGQGLGVALAGILAGVAAALGLTRLMGSLLYEVSPTDASTYVAVSATLLAVAALASSVPAFRATRVNPIAALRTD